MGAIQKTEIDNFNQVFQLHDPDHTSTMVDLL